MSLTFAPNSTMSKLRNFVMFDDRVKTRRKTYASLWAIVIGLLVASVLYWIVTSMGTGRHATNPFTFIFYLFKEGLEPNTNSIISLTGYLVIFGFSGLSVAIGFKSGLFNIGVSGQMQLPGIVFFAILISSRSNLSNVSNSYLLGMMLVFFLVSMFTGGLAGVLKAYFNVHEVISTIFLNWIITYLGVWLFTRVNGVFFAPNDSAVDQFLHVREGTEYLSLTKDTRQMFINIGIALLALTALVLWFIYTKTTMGYKLKMIGLNKTNSKYVGVNEKLTTISVMAISGGLAGLAGFFHIVIINRHYSGEAVPLLIGFESIAIALIALNSPIGVILTSMLYAIIYNSRPGFQQLDGNLKVSPEFFGIINGVIVFMAALAIMFYFFKPVRSTIKFFYLLGNKEYWENKKLLWGSYRKYIAKEKRELWKLYWQTQKAKRAFKIRQKEYETWVAEKLVLINKLNKDSELTKDLNLQKANQKQMLDLYDLLSKEKFKFLKEKEEHGLNVYKDKKNKLQNQAYSRKVNFKALKEKLFSDWVERVVSSRFIKDKKGEY
ncbi:ABC transporter permease [Mycoplasmopsis gallopavonis]|uniref:ABC-type uncharacterized transport system, permease component n=1 Tax=Mycoplasmopsis gallopavonis TaxID=76629 RepID=A0A449AZ13_9BACT|nr:ABC transporter permease [Mycoplasmopsis gallopavonis]RIV16640.1 ABC transporter permease [Mycoplasmopsis gallopavonis]VEU72696.1 ABC-type uncharacterized transport system, permease component [Mycoplasmopsis gallopavonis]